MKNKKGSFYTRRRRALEMGAEGTHTLEEWEALKKLHNYTCVHCGRKEPEIKLTEDHILPLSRGGPDYIENIQPLCRNCNSKKHNTIPGDYQFYSPDREFELRIARPDPIVSRTIYDYEFGDIVSCLRNILNEHTDTYKRRIDDCLDTEIRDVKCFILMQTPGVSISKLREVFGISAARIWQISERGRKRILNFMLGINLKAEKNGKENKMAASQGFN